MKRKLPAAVVASLLLAFGSPSGAVTPAVHGWVTDSLGHAVKGVQILLASTGGTVQAVTDSVGAWRMGEVTGIAARSAKSASRAKGRIVSENGRLSLRFDGLTLDGRRIDPRTAASVVNAYPAAGVAARAQAETDTLLFVHDGEIRARRTLEPWSQEDLGVTRISLFGTVEDPRDHLTYGTAWIGPQKWMRTNLAHVVDSSWPSRTDGDSNAIHGRRYTWAAAMALDDSCNRASCIDQIKSPHQGACPAKWHVPTQKEWSRMRSTAVEIDLLAKGLGFRTYVIFPTSCFIDDVYRMTCTYATRTVDTTGTDAYGFGALYSGARTAAGLTTFENEAALWWTADHLDANYSYLDSLNVLDPAAARAVKLSAESGIAISAHVKANAFSLRCVAD